MKQPSTSPSLAPPAIDPTPLFELFRGSYATELLTAAVAHFRLFELVGEDGLKSAALQAELGLARRPFIVLTTALRAMNLLQHAGYDWELTPIARDHLLPGKPHFVGDYIGLAAESPGVKEMVTRLRTNRPANAEADD